VVLLPGLRASVPGDDRDLDAAGDGFLYGGRLRQGRFLHGVGEAEMKKPSDWAVLAVVTLLVVPYVLGIMVLCGITYLLHKVL
jgi:hypothetical protein